MMAKATMFFPSDFLWGTASASHLGLGVNPGSDWQTARPEKGGDQTEPSMDYWGIEEQRLSTASEMSNNAFRLSLDWSRIEPEPSHFDQHILAHYRRLLARARDLGLQPVVTLHHFANPRWLADKGDFGSELVVDYFSRYASQVIDALGDQVLLWLTFNEPLLYLINRHLGYGMPEPMEKGWSAFRRAYRWLLTSHAAAYQAMKAARPAAQIGVAKHYRLFETANGNLLDRRRARKLSTTLNDSWWASLASGRMSRPFGRGAIPELAGSFDFIGINYYRSERVPFSLRRSQMIECYRPLAMDWAERSQDKISADGLYKAVKSALPYEKPIYITANGLPDSGSSLLPSYILIHLRQLWQAISFSFPVMGYFLEPFAEGSCDIGTQDRSQSRPEPVSVASWKKSESGHLYGEICAINAISSDLANRYTPQLVEVMFPGRSPESQS